MTIFMLINRFAWLYKCTLDDEIEKVILSKNIKMEPQLIGNAIP